MPLNLDRSLLWRAGKAVATALLLLGVAVLGLLAAAYFIAATREIHIPQSVAPASGRFVGAGDVQLYVQEAGPADGPTVLFTHGLGAWSETWRDTLNDLAGAGFHVVAIDLPPFGYSLRPVDANYTTAAQARRILAAVDTLQLRNVILVGHSFGGRATVEAAMQKPDRWRGLVLVDVALSIGESTDHAPSFPASVLEIRHVRNALVAATATNPLFTREVLKLFTARHEVLTADRVAIYQRPFNVSDTTEAFADWLMAFLLKPDPRRSSEEAEYRHLRLPTRVIWGDLDTVTPLEQARALVGLIPQARLTVLKDVGHIPQIEDNRQFNVVLREVLRSISVSTAEK